ncbi:MAG TPA: hypothetical protein VGI81_27885 [Tepidisphaeraceae bacterium]|jgi:hypothetical protein
MPRQLIPPVWLVALALAIACVVKFYETALAALNSPHLFDGSRFIPYAAFFIVIAIWVAYALWH